MDKKKVYFLVLCFCLSLGIIGATYAYFTAMAVDEDTVSGNAATVTFGLKIEKITDVDNAFGLIPMRNDQAPSAAQMKCSDDLGSAACQLYRITVNADSDTVMFLDGYITTVRKEGIKTRIASVYTSDNEETFNTRFTPSDFVDRDFLSPHYFEVSANDDQGIKTGECVKQSNASFNRSDDSDCFLISNQQIGGSVGRMRVFYMMIWVFDDGKAQNYLQGMELAYQGTVTFVTAQGNEISATFD